MLEHWLISRPAFIAFTVSAWLIAALGGTLLFVLTPLYDAAHRVPALHSALEFLGGTLFVLTLPAALLLLTGMVLFLLLRDSTSFPQRLAWLALFFFTVCFGAALYFFARYRAQRVRLAAAERIQHMEQLIAAPVAEDLQAE